MIKMCQFVYGVKGIYKTVIACEGL